MVASNPPAVSNTNSGQQTKYIGNVPHARIATPNPKGVPFANIQSKGYKKGDQFALLPTNPNDLTSLQQALIQAGYLKPGDVVYGSPDSKTIGAFEQLLTTANLSGMPWQQALSARLASTAAEPPKKGPDVPPLTISLTNPDDIRKIAQSAAQTLHGTYMDDQSLNSFIQSFQAQETAAQTQAYNQQYNPGAQYGDSPYGPGGTSVSAPTSGGAEQQAEDIIRKQQPNEVESNTFTDRLDTILGALRTPGAAR